MRKIIFRGKRVDNGEWVEGYYFKAKRHWNDIGVHEDWIADGAIQNGGWCNVVSKHAVIPTSISEFTGLTDKNGKRIFEGDIIITNKFGTPKRKYVVAYDTEIATYIGEGKKGCARYFTTFSGDADAFEVIGNIHDNPELIGGGENA